MRRSRIWIGWTLSTLTVMSASGCQSTSDARVAAEPGWLPRLSATTEPQAGPTKASTDRAAFTGSRQTLAISGREPASDPLTEEPFIQPVAFSGEPQLAETPFTELSWSDDPFAGRMALTAEDLQAAVQARNPSLQAAYAAWSAATQRYPQEVALPDPKLQTMFAPRTWDGASDVRPSHTIGIAQELPWKGKLRLRGDQACWEAAAAVHDIGEVQLRLREAARLAFVEYWLNARLTELVEANIVALTDFRNTALVKYEQNLVSQQDVLLAEVELQSIQQRRIELDRDRIIAVARINTLLHRPPEMPLPHPSLPESTANETRSAGVLYEVAVQTRPELQAMLSRIESEQTRVALACKEFYPDFELMARYDQMWADKEQIPQVGLNMNLPLNQSRRQAAVDEALFRVQKMRADYDSEVDTIRNEVQMAYASMEASQKTVQLYEEKILTKAEENLQTARAAYIAGTLDFLRLIEAQRQIFELKEKHQEAIAEYHRRRAELQRSVGTPL